MQIILKSSLCNRIGRFYVADKKKILNEEEKISKRWSYLSKVSLKEQPLPVIHEQNEKRNTQIKDIYRFGFTQEEVKNENIMIKNLLSMNNASQTEIMKYRVNEAMKQFQRNTNDTASPAVKAAVLSERLIQGMIHMENNQQDTKAARKLIQKLSERRNTLNFLKRKDYHTYRWLLSEYGIEDNQYPNHKRMFHHVFTFQGIKRGGIKRTATIR